MRSRTRARGVVVATISALLVSLTLLAAPVSAAPASQVACFESNLSGPSSDTYCLLKQWLYVQHHGFPGNGTLFDNGVYAKDVQIASLTMSILGAGPAYYPTDAYPALSRSEIRTAWVLYTRHAQDRFHQTLVNALYRAYLCGCDTRAG